MNNDLHLTIKQVLRHLEEREVGHRQEVLASKTNLVHDQAWLSWRKGELQFSLCESNVWKGIQWVKENNPDLYESLGCLTPCGRFNGYVTFPKLPVVAPGYSGILTYDPVHGGINYFQDWWDGSCTYGFDTAHLNPREIPEVLNDIDWMRQETESMARGIQIATRFEPYYLNASTNSRKAAVLMRMNRFLPLDIEGKIGALLAAMTGEL